ncbi:MAG: hypothetical protein MI724_12360 [Spirochaetales bacterium]|nr:hypothetical protein [Spirochaetales bacterium]
MTSKRELDDQAVSIAHRFTRLAEAAIDASSMIYMLKAGFLGLLGGTLTLKTIPSIFAETQWPALPVTVVDGHSEAHTSEPRPGALLRRAPPAEGADEANSPVAREADERGAAFRAPTHSGADERPNDEQLLHFAVGASLPLISDDRALLLAAAHLGLEYYNSLMMLAFLRYRGRIDEAWHDEALGRLLEIGRYGEDVLRRFEAISRVLYG